MKKKEKRRRRRKGKGSKETNMGSVKNNKRNGESDQGMMKKMMGKNDRIDSELSRVNDLKKVYN